MTIEQVILNNFLISLEQDSHIFDKRLTVDEYINLKGAIASAIKALGDERHHGEWIEKPWGVVCSRCKAQALHTPNGNQSRSDFCPDCGADMRKECEEE